MTTIHNQENICPRCHVRAKFLETFKKCSYCSKKHCHQCWVELQISDDYKILIDTLPKTDDGNIRRICPACIKTLLHHTGSSSVGKQQEMNDDDDEDYQLALAMSLSQSETDEKKKYKRKFEEEKCVQKIDLVETKSYDNNEKLLEQTAEAIGRFMNRAKSNYQRNRDSMGDTALLSTFISLQTCAIDLEQLKHNLDHQRQHFETLQEKLTALRDAREALNILRYEHQEKKHQERAHREQQRRVIMIQKVADLRQYKHTQIANFQENYFQRLLDEEREMNERLQKQKLIKEEQFGS